MNLSTKARYSQEVFDSIENFSFEKIKEVYFQYDKNHYSYDFAWLKRKYDNIFYKEYNSLIDFINKLDYNHKLYNMAKLEQKVSEAPYIYGYLDVNGSHSLIMNAESIKMEYTKKI